MPSRSSDSTPKCIGREEQKTFLLNAFGKDDDTILPASLFLWGDASTGKSVAVQQTLRDAGITRTATVNCHEFLLGINPVFRSIISQISPDKSPPQGKCESIIKFIRELKELINQSDIGQKRIVIMVKKVEFLRKNLPNPDILILFTSLRDQIQANICTVLCSSLPLGLYFEIIRKKSTPTLYFPQYNKDQICKILASKKLLNNKEEESVEYANYIKFLLDVFGYLCRDLSFLQKLANHHWADFKKEKMDKNYWKKIEPKIKQTFNMMDAKILPIIELSSDGLENSVNQPEEGVSDLPRYSKFLLIAAYIASQNPISTDKRFFLPGRETTSRKRKAEGSTKESRGLKGPQIFTQIRFFAMFNKVLGEYVDNDVIFKVHVSSLLSLGLLQLVSGVDKSLDQCKFKCNFDFHFIERISKSIGFQIRDYLYSYQIQ